MESDNSTEDATLLEPQEDGARELPESYRTNSAKEQLLLSYTDNFNRQFKKLYGDRKPQFLRPLNDCGVEKFVCNTLRPTCLHYKELYDWDGCASFVADYVTCSPLHPPDELPKELLSPTLTLDRQEGSSFDMSSLLCSLLLGVGYDAYCVCGYSVREVTEVDQCDKTCPLLEEGEQVEEGAVEKKTSRYIVRPPRDLASQFERRQEAKALAEEEKKRREQQLANAPAEEESAVDKYHGLRVHCWVLVLSGKREVAQSFFIETTTGESHPVDGEMYLGIESLWNYRNYWINMQDCAQGLKNVVYDLGDATKWEFFFPNVEQPLLVVPEDSSVVLGKEEEKQDDGKVDFELPPSWVLPIHISRKDFESRCPRRKKTILYHKSRLEKFSDYLNSNGLVSRLTLYSDTACRSKVETRSVYHHREDHLLSRVEDARAGAVCEVFGPGRERGLQEHSYSTVHSSNRTMLFYSNARVDGLSKRELTASEMLEHFEQREDHLYQRLTTYTKPVGRKEPSTGQHRREIQTIVERFRHNPALPPNSDVAERRYQLLGTTSIRVTYHLEPDRITASHQHFIAPPRGGEQAYNLTFDPQAIFEYQVDPYAPEPKSQHLFQQLEALMEAQETAIAQVRASEDEVAAILRRREEEEENPVLVVAVYDVARNQKAFQQREEEEEQTREEERLQREKERDYLAPFLGRLVGHCGTLNQEQIATVTEECLKDTRQSLVEKANQIQARFDVETESLSRKQAWYKANQSSLTRDREADYIAYCNEALFRIHILEQRLNIHKRTAPEKYLQLERRLREDPRLRPH